MCSSLSIVVFFQLILTIHLALERAICYVHSLASYVKKIIGTATCLVMFQKNITGNFFVPSSFIYSNNVRYKIYAILLYIN